MFGGGWGRLAARGEGSGGGDGGVALGLSPFFLSLELHTYPGIFFASYVAGKATRTQSGREGQTAYYVERKALRCGARKATLVHLHVASYFMNFRFGWAKKSELLNS